MREEYVQDRLSLFITSTVYHRLLLSAKKIAENIEKLYFAYVVHKIQLELGVKPNDTALPSVLADEG
jgi:hypothetical protein